VTTVVAILAEAWSEIRVHKLRVILSLVGVFLAVFGMTSIAAAGDIGRQLVAESSERSGGRPATVMVQAYPLFSGPDNEVISTAMREVVERYDIRWSSLVLDEEIIANFPGQSERGSVRSVDPAFGIMHRLLLEHGRWFTPADVQRYAPALVVSPSFLERLGGFDPNRPPTVRLGGDSPVLATVIGVLADDDFGSPFAYLVNDSDSGWTAGSNPYGQPPMLEMWVPPEQVDQVMAAVTGDLLLTLPGHDVFAQRADAGDQLAQLDLVLNYGVRGVGYFALLLGGVGVLNVGMVVVGQRIREIGVRRSFGATSGRVFLTILLESVCATAVAGALAIGCAIALVLNLPYEQILSVPIEDLPPFPLKAAVEGFLAATAVGALAGLIPAIVAVQAKVIDAIRY